MKREPVLCYASGSAAYFTTQRLEDQWGDDWNDRPYEHNAGEPYSPMRPGDDWVITQIFWEGPFETPDMDYGNSPYSVEDINAGIAAWLRAPAWASHRSIFAGTTLDEFISHVQTVGGRVWLEADAR